MDLFTKDGDNFVPYSGPKLIPESDLLAVKGGLEAEVRAMKEQFAGVNKTSDDNLQRAIRAETAAEAVKPELESLRTKAATIDTLTSQIEAATKSRTELEGKFLVSRRQELVGKYRMPVDKAKELESLSFDSLNQLDETLSKFGTPVGGGSLTPNRFDTGGGGGNTQAPLRGRELIKQGLAAGTGNGTST